MSLRVNTNIAAMSAHNNMTKNANGLSSSLEKLSSGLRINRAADDSSGMAIADALRSQSMGLGQAIRNANDGISMVQTADGALEESINIINTVKTKAIQAAQDGQTSESRMAIQADIDKLMENLDNIAKTTAFNNQKLLSGNFTNKAFQVGAYANETVNINIASTEATKIGHVTTSNLTLAGDEPGRVEIAIYSNLQNKNFEIQGVDVAFNNSRENSMAAVADSINKLSDTLGITANAVVSSTHSDSVRGGELREFSINGVDMNGIKVSANDSDGSLANGINQKSSEHGVVASINNQGMLTLNSLDGRAINVQMDDVSRQEVFRGDDLSTVGYVQLQQDGSSEIKISNIDGGDVVSLTNNMDIQRSDTYTVAADATVGSRLGATTTLGAGWSTGQDIVTSAAFVDDIVTSQSSVLAAGTTLAAESTIVLQGAVSANITLGDDSGLTTDTSTLALYSDIKEESILAAGTVFGQGVTASGVKLHGEAVIEATAATDKDSLVQSGSTLAAGTVLAANTTLAGGDFTVMATEYTVGDSTIKSGSTLNAGSVIGANSDFTGHSGLVIVEATGTTLGTSTIGSGSTLTAGSVLGAGTLIEGDVKHDGTSGVKVMQTDTIDGFTASSTIASGSTLTDGTVLAAGTYLASGVTITGRDNTVHGNAAGYTLSGSVTLQGDKTLGGTESITANVGSSLANNSILTSGSTVYADLTLAANMTASGTTMTLQDGSSLGGGSQLAKFEVATDMTLRFGATLNDDVVLKTGSMLSEGSSLKADSEVGADITLKSNTTLTSGDLTADAGSSFAAGTRLMADSVIGADVTLQRAMTLEADMGNILDEVVLATGSRLADESVIAANSVYHGKIETANDVYFERKTEVGAGTIIKQDGSFIKAGSTIGGKAVLDVDMNIIKDTFTLGVGSKLANNTQLANGSTLGGTVTLALNETVDGQMKLAENSVLAEGSLLKAGTYLTNDIRTDQGVLEAGTVMREDATTVGRNVLANEMTLQDGSVIAQGSQLAANTHRNSAKAEMGDMDTSRLSEVNVMTQEGAQQAIKIADKALKDLGKIRGDLGAAQNQLTSTISNITVTRVNISSAESNIRDVDFAEEAANFSKMQVLNQAGSFAMAQANATAQNVLSLLQG